MKISEIIWRSPIKMKDLSLHILDIIENSVNAGAKNIEISIKPTEKEYTELKTLLPVLTNKKGKISINDWQTVGAIT